jgi:hypothetical protein
MAKIYNSGSSASIIIFVDNNLAVASFARGQVRAGEAGGNLQLYDLSSGIEPRTFFNGAASTLTDFGGTSYGATPSAVINNSTFADVIGTNSGGGGASVPNTRQIATTLPLKGGGSLTADLLLELTTTGVPTQTPAATDLILFQSGGLWAKNTLQNVFDAFQQIEFGTLGTFPIVGSVNVLYVDTAAQALYLWTGAVYNKLTPNNVFTLLGNYNALTNTPNLVDGVGTVGDTYIVSVGGVRNFGSGNIDLNPSDKLFYANGIWNKEDNTDAVFSVNGFQGIVVLTTTNIAEGTNLYFTTARVLATTLTGFVVGSNSAILATDSVLQAFSKTQGQINAINTAALANILQNGNTLAANIVIGTNDNFSLSFETNAITRATISNGGVFNIANLTNLGNRLIQANSAGDLQVTSIDPADISLLSNLTENVQDIVGAFVVAGAGITITYNDPANTLTIASSITQYTDEQAQDAIGNALVNSSNIAFTYNDPANSITADLISTAVTAAAYGSATQIPTFTVDSKGRLTLATNVNIAIPSTQITDFVESSQDAIALALTDTNSIDFTYNDVANTIKADIKISANAGNGASIVGDGLFVSSSAAINNKVFYVSTVGNDTNVGYDINKPFLTLSAALTAAGSSGNKIVVLPGTYAGNYTVNNLNLSISTIGHETGGIVNFTGTITFASNNAGSSVRVLGLAMTNIVHSGLSSLYLHNCKIDGTTTLSGNGFFGSIGTDTQGSALTGSISITGSGNKVFTDHSYIGFLTVNNASAAVNCSNNIISSSMTLTLGTLGITNTPVYALTNGGDSITATGGVLYCDNIMALNPNNTIGKVSIGASVAYTFSNFKYDNASSILGTNLNRFSSFDQLEIKNAQTSVTSEILYIATNGRITKGAAISSDGTQIITAANTTTNVNLALISSGKFEIDMSALTANTAIVVTNPVNGRDYSFLFRGNANRNVMFPASFVWDDGLAFDGFSSSSASNKVIFTYYSSILQYIVKR